MIRDTSIGVRMKILLSSHTDRVNNSNHPGRPAWWFYLSIQAENMISDWTGHSLNHPADPAAAANAFALFYLFPSMQEQ